MTHALEADHPVTTSEKPEEPMTVLQQWEVAIGNFFFRYRNALFPVIIAFVTLVTRPHIMFGHATLDRWLTFCGGGVAVIGQLIRLTTIGFEYIERGGKNHRVYASRIVQGGVYGVVRNPMYIGNAMIASGLTMVAGAPLAYLVVIPFFLFVYQAIVVAEEAYLHRQFGQEYDDYCARVPRFLPSFRHAQAAFAGMRYNWKRAIRQDLSTFIGTLTGLTLLPLWRTAWLHGWEDAFVEVPQALEALLGIGVLYGLLFYCKKRGYLSS